MIYRALIALQLIKCPGGIITVEMQILLANMGCLENRQLFYWVWEAELLQFKKYFLKLDLAIVKLGLEWLVHLVTKATI